MTPPTDRSPGIDAASAPSVHSCVDETAAAPNTPAVGTAAPGFGPPAAAGEVGTLGPYRIVKELGKGGMGAVYAAVDTRLDRRLALKVMLPEYAADPASRERFLREARAAARIKHDHVVTVYEADERNGVPYIAMEFLEGYPLDEYLKKKGNPSPAQVLRLAAETAAGLAAAHKQGLVHRDIKPGNLWLEAPAGRVKVLDFGLARPVDAEVELTKSGAVVGTPAYMSPEQARGERVDHRTDLFGLGAVLYRLATGRLPFQAPNTMAMLIALGTEDPPPVRERNPAVPEPLAELIYQLLAKSPDARPASADEVVKRVRAMSAARSAPASAPAASQVVYVPIQVTAVPEANPFADLDASATELEAAPAPAAAPVGRKPGGSWAWTAAGFAALVLFALGGVIIIIRNKDGTETKLEVPDGSTVTVKGKDGKTLATVGPGGKAPVADDSPDRKVAEWIISRGGSVWVAGDNKDVRVAADLPPGRLSLYRANLRGTGLTDEELTRLKNCTQLGIVDLINTKVTDLTPLRASAAIQELNLDGPVTDAGLAPVSGFKMLTTLRADNTRLTDAALVHIKDATALVEVVLNGTAVSDAGLVHLAGNTELRVLNLANTKVTGSGLAHLRGSDRLESLSLDGSGLTDSGMTEIRKFSGLRIFGASNTVITNAGLVHLKECTKLTDLHLKDTEVTDLASVRDCKELKYLFIKRTPITDAGLAPVGGYKGLTMLHADHTRLTDAGLVHLKDAAALTDLSLSGLLITDAGLMPLHGCQRLATLDVKGTKVTAKGLADFHAAVPGCRIEHDGGFIEAKK